MTAIGKPGASTLAERAESFAFSEQLLREYQRQDTTAREMGLKYGLSGKTIYRRMTEARDRRTR